MKEVFSGGHRLDVADGVVGTLRPSNDILDDVEAQKERMRSDGYLLFRNLIPREDVLAARREILLKYAIVGEIDNIRYDVMDAIRQERCFVDQVNLTAFTESIRTGMAYERVVLHPNLMAFYQEFLGGPVRCFDFRWPRFVRPGEGTGIHADIVYVGRGTRNLWSTWIPIGDVPWTDGSLVILEGSHKHVEELADYWSKDADRDHLGWLTDDPVALRDRLGERWLTTDFQAGDVICFSVCLVHGSLDNRSQIGRCRLTSDTRYQLASEALDDRWNGDISNPHGGAPKVFLPGRVQGSSNINFEEEWKPIDSWGRLLTTRRRGPDPDTTWRERASAGADC